MEEKKIEVKDVKGVVNAESGATINQHFHTEESNKKHYYLLSSIVVISIFTLWNISHTDVINNSGNIVMNYSTKIYNDNDKEEEKKYEIEFLDLLMMFSPPAGMNWNIGALKWSVGADKDSKINWLYSGIEDIESSTKDVPKTFGGYIREGRVSILNNGKASHTILKKVNNPVEWDIKLFGVRSGVNIVMLSNSVYSQEGGQLIIPQRFVSYVKNICENPPYSAMTFQLYEIDIPNRSKFWIVEHEDGGTAGMIYEYIVFLYEPSLENMKEILAECSEI